MRKERKTFFSKSIQFFELTVVLLITMEMNSTNKHVGLMYYTYISLNIKWLLYKNLKTLLQQKHIVILLKNLIVSIQLILI